jgi:hypothetical protein
MNIRNLKASALIFACIASGCSDASSSNSAADMVGFPTKPPPPIPVGAEEAKLEKLRWTTPYPNTCVRDPERRGKIVRARALKPDPAGTDFMGLKLPERARIVDACEVEIAGKGQGRRLEKRYMVFSDEWPGPVAYFMSLGLEHGMYFQDFDQCDFACKPRGPIPRGISHYRQGEMQIDCWRTDLLMDIDQPRPDSLIGEIVISKTIKLHRNSGIMDANGCSG